MGTKLQKTVDYGSYQVITDYLAGYQYETKPVAQGGRGYAQLLFYPTPEGYVKALYKDANHPLAYQYVYNYTDHLGNIRLSYTWDARHHQIKTLQENHYYPFGLRHHAYAPLIRTVRLRQSTEKEIRQIPPEAVVYKYKYQGQERQDELNLNWDSFKYRNYDYALGRFMSIDPLAEKFPIWAPYVFSGNRILDARELEGLEPHKLFKTVDLAAINFATQYNGLSIRSNLEIKTYFYMTTDKNGNVYYSYTIPTMGSEGIVMNEPEAVGDYGTQIGSGHTHAADRNYESKYNLENEKDSYKKFDNYPSGQDVDEAFKEWRKRGKTNYYVMYVVTPNGTIYKIEPNVNVRWYDEAIKEVDGASKVVPSDPNSNTRKNKISPNVTPNILPKNLKKDDFPHIPDIPIIPDHKFKHND